MTEHAPLPHRAATPASPEADAERDAITAELARLERASRPLDPGAGRRKVLRNAVVASSERWLRGMRSLKSYVETEDRGAGLLRAPIGERGMGIEEAIEIIERDVVRPGGSPGAAGHLAYIPGGGLYHSALAEYLAAVTNKYAGIFFTGPGPTRMENMLVRWTADLAGYPAGASGHIASGGSLANLAAIATARDAHELRGADYASAVVYLTHQAHHAIHKALRLVGMAEAQLRTVDTDAGQRMRPDALAAAIAADRAAGLRPWLVVAAAGTTDVGAVDPLESIGRIAKREGCWYHVDAAYGGFFLLTEHGKRLMRGIELSDSVVMDPHKSLFLPWGSGVVIVRDGAALARTHSYSGAYMQDKFEDPGTVSAADVSPELSKPFRALAMWLPLILCGVAPFRAALDEKLLLARYFRAKAAAMGLEVGPEPDLSIVTFRWVPAGAGPERADELNRALVDAVRLDGRIFISSTLLDGRFTLRMAALSFRTHSRQIDLLLRILREKMAEIGG